MVIKRILRTLPALAMCIVVAPIVFFIAGIGIAIYKGAALSASVGISRGTGRPSVEARMASAGFECHPYNEKELVPVPPSRNELACSKKELLGLGIANTNSQFLIAIFPTEWLYAILPKNDATLTYRESAIIFVFDNEIVSSIHPSVLLRSQGTIRRTTSAASN
jgi:hypothetical protein